MEGADMKRLFAPAVLVLILVLFHWKLILTDQYTWLGSPDMFNQVLPAYQFSASEVQHGRLPLWDPYSFGGQPLVGQMQMSVAYPLHWLFLAVPLDRGWLREAALHWYYILIRCFVALAMFALCRSLQRSPAASVAAGLIYALGGVENHADWPQMVHATAWAPLAILFLLRVLAGVQRLRNSVLAGCMLGAAWLCGHHAYPFFLSLASGGVWLYVILRKREWTLARYAAVFYGFSFLIGAMQLLPAAEYGRLARRWVGAPDALTWNQVVPYNIHEMFSMTPAGMLGFVFPYWSAGYDPFVGIVACGLALLGAALAWQERPVRVLAAIGAGALLYSLTGATPLHGLLYAFVPMVEKTRVPAMATYLVSLAVAVLASFGIDYCLKRAYSRWFQRFGWGLALFGSGILAVGAVLTAMGSPAVAGEPAWLLTGAYALVLAAWIATASRGILGVRWAATLPAILVVLELTKGPSSTWRNRRDPTQPDILAPLKQDADIAQFLYREPGAWRADASDDVEYTFGPWWGIESMRGMAAGMTDNLLWHDMNSRKFLQLMSVRYHIAKEANQNDQIPIYDTGRGLKVFENSMVMPRLWVTHDVRRFSSRKFLQQAFFDPSLELKRTTLVMDATPKLETCAGAADEADFKARVPNKVTIQATLGCRGILNLNDVYFPGWTATVDGQAAKVYETYGVIRGVVVEQGSHTVVFRYRPRSVLMGALLSAAGLIAAVVLCWRTRRG
jgi:hypothetical protein